MPKSKSRKKKPPKRVLALPDLEQALPPAGTLRSRRMLACPFPGRRPRCPANLSGQSSNFGDLGTPQFTVSRVPETGDLGTIAQNTTTRGHMLNRQRHAAQRPQHNLRQVSDR